MRATVRILPVVVTVGQQAYPALSAGFWATLPRFRRPERWETQPMVIESRLDHGRCR